ncbi:SRPBCC domain-containing protein [Chitinophaga lutea]|uniref:SRPBCC domain-containing protein n=1 Tax=Chitinophaga lutea TaxID=2488634 RepID=A0A3N4PBV7_9BACT|nr:SRPBCC domain-containing protein [Chitinophaga lutea]RPE05716.1 SRPBCC domain-containing protein [Chitinophaga lutea]
MFHIEQLQFINAPAAKVYEALTTQEGLGAVWTNKLIVRPGLGAVNEFDFNDNYATKMEVAELEENKHILWKCISDADPEWGGTSVLFDLSEKNGVTTVDFRHLNWREVSRCYRSCNYNWAMFLFSLKSYVEDGQGLNFQQRKW